MTACGSVRAVCIHTLEQPVPGISRRRVNHAPAPCLLGHGGYTLDADTWAERHRHWLRNWRL
jgi:hypothetical protein